MFYIYRIKNCNYIGSTFDIKERLILHKSDCYNINRHHYNRKVYKYIRKYNIKIELEIIRIIYFDDEIYNNKFKWEQYFIDKYDSKKNGLNERNAYTSNRQRIKNNKKRCKNFWDKNRDELNAKRRVKIPCPLCNKIISKSSITEHQKSKKCQMIANNTYKPVLKIACFKCNTLINKRNIPRHQKTKKCLMIANKIN